VNATVPLTSFVGRRAELAQLRNALASARLLTLIGPAGTGKTRLALELARRAARPTEVVGIAELAPLADRGQVDVTVSASFGLVPEGDARRQLVEWLRDRPALIVLDNCEHVLEPAGDLAAVLLAECPRVRILATSREALSIDGETVWSVPPLSLPSQTRSARDWQRSDALRLFEERARPVAPSFALSETNARAVGEICAAVGGLPLAIELAAARLRNLTFEDVRRGLGQRLQLLAPPGVTPTGRHETMRAAIEWSHSLLGVRERRVFRRLAVFSGGCDSEAARIVCADEEIPESDVLPIVSTLVDVSLAQLIASDQRQRYSLLEVIREYARERLIEAGEGRLAETRRAAHVASLFDAFGPHRQKDREGALDRIFAEHPNVRDSMEWLLEHDLPVARRMLAKAWLAYVFLRPGMDPSEIEGWLVRALEREPKPDELRTRMLIALSQRRFAGGDRDGSETAAAEALLVAKGSTDAHGIAGAHHRLALSRQAAGDTPGALPHFAEAIALYRTTNLPGCAWALAHRGLARTSSGDPIGARADFGEALSICDAHPHLPRLRAIVRTLQGEHLTSAGEHEGARAAFADALDAYTEFGGDIPVGRALNGLARLAAAAGKTERALRLAGAASDLRARTGDTWPASGDDATLALARERLGKRGWALWSEGRALSVSEAVSFALVDQRSTKRPLTRREEEVATLVAEGLTSREIGRRLRITERTAETHVDHILVKLDLRSRAQIASWATARDRTTSHRDTPQ
jgi:predicted ATPase/DNA-binding CsgD family transcriptional regulator